MPEGRSRRAADGREVRRRARGRRLPIDDIFGKEQFLSRNSGPGLGEEKRIQSGPAEAGEGSRPAAGRDQRQPLPVRRRRARAGRDGLHPDRQVDQRHQPHEVRRQPVLREEPATRWCSVFKDTTAGAGAHAGDRRALQRAPGKSQRPVPAVRRARRATPSTDYFEHVTREGFAKRLEALRDTARARAG